MIPLRDRHETIETGAAAPRFAGLVARLSRRGRICRLPGRRVRLRGLATARHNQKLCKINIHNLGMKSAFAPAAPGSLAEGFVDRGLSSP